MSIYARLASTASRLLTTYGQTVTLRRTTGGSVNPVTGATVAGTVQTLTAPGILQRYPDELVDGTRILASDRMLILDSTVQPQITDLVSLEGQQWTLVQIQTINPAGTPLVYMLQVRR